MKVYRLEHKGHRHGAYAADESQDIWQGWIGGTASNDKHPSPWQDSLLTDTDFDKYCYSDTRYGFKTLKQFRNWFYNDSVLSQFHKEGFVLTVYSVKKLFIGHTQCVFLAEDHKNENIVKEICLLTLARD